MKHALISADKDHTYDPPAWDTIRAMPGRVDCVQDADVLGLVITKQHNFKFRDSLADEMRGKKWVLYNWVENGWDWDQEETMTFGINTERFFGGDYSEEWRKFDQFVRDNPPILTFQRELLQKDHTDKLLPIEYLAHLPEFGADDNDQFFKRPLEVSYYWGRSSEDRVYMHASIFAEASRRGFDVVTQFDHVDLAIKDNPQSKKWLSVFAPHYARLEVTEVQSIVRKSKVTIVMPGAGVKTFRHGESCSDAIMAIPHNKLAWSYPWTSQNSISLAKNESGECRADQIVRWLQNISENEQMDVYRAAMENARNYRTFDYLRRWVVGNIEKHL